MTEMERVKEAYFIRCSCGVLCDNVQAQILHYAYVHNNIEPLLEYYQAEIADLRRQIAQKW